MIKKNLIFIAILLLAVFFRFYNLNWDQNLHLHPDERFLTMVGNTMKHPKNLADYLNPKTSTFNPSSTGFNFFVYGASPLILNKFLAITLSTDNYNSFTIQGRFLSALVDFLIVFLIYKTVSLFEKKYKINQSIKYLAGFFYSIAVLPIQLSHFFTVDTFLNFFMFASFYFALCYSFKKTLISLILSGAFFGLSLSSKISAIFILPLNLFLITGFILNRKFFSLYFFKNFSLNKSFLNKIKIILLLLILYFLTSYIFLRLTDPYLFEDNNFFNPIINSQFINNLRALKSFEGENTLYPPAIQWISKPPIIFSLFNLSLFGVGLPYFIFIITGFYFIFKKIKKDKLLLISFWIILFFIYQSSQFVKTMRYFIFIYPFLAIFAGFGFYHLVWNRNFVYKLTLIFIFLVWPLAFFSIYTKNNSRLKASLWIYKNIENKSLILVEHWDDPLPFPLKDSYGKSFSLESLPVFDPDTEQKWEKMNYLLQKGDYLVLSSNRAWGSISAVPKKYPLMSKFYKNLFEEKLAYKKIKEFASYPSIGSIDIPDDLAEENFTVFDHPKIIIYKNSTKL